MRHQTVRLVERGVPANEPKHPDRNDGESSPERGRGDSHAAQEEAAGIMGFVVNLLVRGIRAGELLVQRRHLSSGLLALFGELPALCAPVLLQRLLRGPEKVRQVPAARGSESSHCCKMSGDQ